jgi:hypothetical protein
MNTQVVYEIKHSGKPGPKGGIRITRTALLTVAAGAAAGIVELLTKSKSKSVEGYEALDLQHFDTVEEFEAAQNAKVEAEQVEANKTATAALAKKLSPDQKAYLAKLAETDPQAALAVLLGTPETAPVADAKAA